MAKFCSWLFRLKKTRSLWIAVLLIALITIVLSVTRASLHTDWRGVQLLAVRTSLARQTIRRAHLGARRGVNDYKDGGKDDSNHDHGHYIVDNFDSINDSSLAFLHEGHEDVWMNQDSSHTNDSQTLRVNVSLWDPECEWVRFTTHKPPYYLTVVLLVRIYEKDKAKLTTREMKQWLQYLRYAGVEHVYVYDAWVEPSESQEEPLKKFIDEGYVTYIDWHTHNPYSISGTQVAAYQDCIVKYGAEVQWTAAIDIDEYPFSPMDTRPGFLFRYVKHYSEYHTNVVEISMQNFLFLGKPLERELLIDRLWRRTHKPANPLVKPIYQPKKVRAQVHHNLITNGRSQNAPYDELRMNHYWGARLQEWGEDTPDIIEKTRVDEGMKPVVEAFKKCELYTRSYIE